MIYEEKSDKTEENAGTPNNYPKAPLGQGRISLAKHNSLPIQPKTSNPANVVHPGCFGTRSTAYIHLEEIALQTIGKVLRSRDAIIQRQNLILCLKKH
jgi:hypothetical protein